MNSSKQKVLEKNVFPDWLKKGLSLTIFISITTVVVLFLFGTTSETWKGLFSFRLQNVVLLFIIIVLSWLIEGLRVKIITKALEEEIGLFDILRINLATLFSGNVTPFTSGGLPTQVYLLHQKGISVGKATAVVTIRVTFSNLFFALGGPITLYFLRNKILRELELTFLSGIINYILFLALGFSFLVLLYLWRPAKGGALVERFFRFKIIHKVLGAKTEPLCQRIIKELEDFHTCIGVLLKKNLLQILSIIGLTILYWVTFFCIAPAVLMGYGVKIIGDIFRLIILQFIVMFLISFIPIPGGSGLAEMGLYSVFAIYLPKHLLAIAVIIWRFISYHLNTLVGGFFFARLLFHREKKEADLPG